MKESEMEIALTISKVPSEEDTEVCETCVEYDNQEYSDEIHCTEELQGDIELKRRAYIKFYDSDNEDEEEFDIEEEEDWDDILFQNWKHDWNRGQKKKR